MEIHIQLAGVELGPYSEKQVRDYLQEDLLSLTDPARFHGTDTWQTVQEVLDANAVAPAPPAIVEPSKDLTPIVVAPQPPVATGTLPLPMPTSSPMSVPKTALRKTAGITTSLLPIPKTLSKDTIRVPIPQLNKSVAQQTTMVKKAIPMVPQPPAPSTNAATRASEKARTSLLTAVKILAKKADPEVATPPAEPAAPPFKASSPSTVPIAFPKSSETRTMPMSVVRAIAKKSDLEEKPASPADSGFTDVLPKPTATFGKPKELDPKRTSLLAPPKVPLKKLEPEIKPVQAAAPAAAPATPAAPDVSRVSAKLPQTVSTSPMAPVRVLAKKQDPETKGLPVIPPPKPPSARTTPPAEKASDTSSVETLRFVPRSAPLPPGEVSKAPPVSEDANFSNKTLKRTTGSLPALVKVLAKKPDEPAALPPEKEEEIQPPVAEEAPVEEESGEPKPSFFKSIGGKIGTMFKSKTVEEPEPQPEPEVEAKPEMTEVPENKPEIENKVLTKKTTPIQARLDLKDKLASKERPEYQRKSEPKASAATGARPLVGLTTLPPAPEDEEKAPSKTQSLFEKEMPSAVPPPARSTRATILVLFGMLLVAGIAATVYLYVESSYQAAAALLQALKSGDEAQLKKLVDFPSVQKTLADQVMSQTAKSGNQDASSRDAVSAMIQNSINYYITPEAISALATKSALPPAGTDPTVTPALATDILSKLNDLPVKSQSLVSYNHFVVDLDAAKLDLVFSGSVWKLNQVELNASFKMPEAAGSSTPSADLGTSMSEPVIETYFDDGKDKFEKKDWDGAIADFNQVLAMDPKPEIGYIAYSNRGMARRLKADMEASKGDAEGSKSDMEAAIADFTQAIAINPNLAEAYDNRGNAKAAQKDLDGAIGDYNQAINLDPKLADAFFERGTIRTEKGDMEGAIADFSQDVTLDPTNAKAFSNRGYVRQAQRDFDGAISDFTQALAIDPKIVVAYFNRGSAKYQKADLDGAIADFNKALDLDPKMTRAYYSRGIAKNTKNDLDGALADYNQALVLDPNLVPALKDRALVRQAKGDLKGALDDYNRVLTLDPKQGNAYYARGLIKEQLGDLDGAISDSSRAIDIDPKRAQAYYNRGFAKLVKGNLEGAKNDLQKFCELASRDPYADHARLYLWLISKAQSPTSTANQDLSDALQNNWSLGPSDLVTKIAEFLLDRETEADLFASAASPDPQKDAGNHCEVWYFAGMKRLLAGDKPTAIDYFHKCIATGQKDYCEYILAQSELQILLPNP